jgi:uncharacterized RDD family membrane protein YckC
MRRVVLDPKSKGGKMGDQAWYYAKNDQQVGPVSRDELERRAGQGMVSPEDLVWTDGLADWQPFRTIFGGGVATVVAPAPSAQAYSNTSSPYSPSTLNYQTPAAYYSPVQYAGFWLRFCAAFIDGILLWLVQMISNFALLSFLGRTRGAGNLLLPLFNVSCAWLYCALMESSEQQATLGKLALGIRVTDATGQRISFGRATGRHFAKWISALTLCIGYMMAGWTEYKQALHDLIAGTLVIRR